MTSIIHIDDVITHFYYYGLNSKLSCFYNSVSSCDYDLIALTETWIHPGVRDSELFDKNFIVYREDRDFKKTDLSRKAVKD